MKNRIVYIIGVLVIVCCKTFAQSTIRLTDGMLMHEMRAMPSPLNRAVISERKVSFLWPLPEGFHTLSAGLDGMEPQKRKGTMEYKIRLSRNPDMKKNVMEASTSWPFYNPDHLLQEGNWYWQYGYAEVTGIRWSEVLAFKIIDNPSVFNPPSFATFISKLPSNHPRVMLSKPEWNDFIKRSSDTSERSWYLNAAEASLKKGLDPLSQQIDTSKIGTLDNEVKRNALLTRESRRIVDREESNTEVLIRAYLLTKDTRYSKEAMNRISEIITWGESPYFVGDFNELTLLSLSSMAYDAFHDQLTSQQKRMLLNEIQRNGNSVFKHFVNHLENHIADNHNWQMGLRIFTMAAFAVYGELPEAAVWTDYCYNIWQARFPGLNKDGAWHNGDSYFHVNIRTLIEVPYFYSRVSGYDFFKDPWYKGSAMYVICHQPPFSKSAGNGSSHQNVLLPSGTRVAYVDALARLTQNKSAAAYVNAIIQSEPGIMKKGFLAKPGDLSWFRLQCNKPLPQGGSLGDLPLAWVFPQTGLVTFMSHWNDISKNAMLSFRSSPYGSTSHALANQNAFNTFFGGKPLFYSSGHHVSFTDEHSVYCHRATRAHNSILVNGMGQKIGTEGYGWIPRHYTGKGISYVVGDASNAYGEVISPLWLQRGEASGLEYSPANGWDKNHLKTFRRHIVTLGDAGLIVVYDELEADTAVTWSYLLHTIENKMEVKTRDGFKQITATNETGASDAYLFCDDNLQTEQTNRFFYPAVNWLRADDNGYFPPYKDHWHFTATTPSRSTCRFATIISTHNKSDMGMVPKQISANKIRVGNWVITIELRHGKKATFSVVNEKENISLEYDDTTRIKEEGKTVVLKDEFPELEI